MSRYDGKPFLRLLDCYVLNSIGCPDECQDLALSVMAPKLADTFGFSGSCVEIVAHQMDFPPTLPARIKQMWDNGRAAAQAVGVTVDPNEFTR
jgi:hypothetical protein